MIVLLPYPDFVETAGALSTKDLRSRSTDILKVLDWFHSVDPLSEHIENHPVYKAWKGYEVSLVDFGLILAEEHEARCGQRAAWTSRLNQHMEWATAGEYSLEKPPWFGSYVIHSSHQSFLVLHDPEHYGPQFPDAPADRPLAWPR